MNISSEVVYAMNKVALSTLIEKLLVLGRVPEVYPQVIQDGPVQRAVQRLRDDTGFHDLCPYCGSKSKDDERGNCAACGGPR